MFETCYLVGLVEDAVVDGLAAVTHVDEGGLRQGCIHTYAHTHKD